MLSTQTTPRKLPGLKVTFVGPESSGKTSIVQRHKDNSFFEHQQTTVGANFINSNIEVNQTSTPINIWDTAGAGRYRSLAPMYTRNAAIIIIVLSHTDENALSQFNSWMNVISNTITDRTVTIVAFNKTDLLCADDTQKTQIKDLCSTKNIPVRDVSAKSGVGIKELFQFAIERYYELNSLSEEEIESKLQFDFDSYLKYKFRLFGTHHIDRANAMKDALNACDNTAIKLALIENQVALLKEEKPTNKLQELITAKWGEDETRIPKKLQDFISDGWTSKISNTPKKLVESGYYKVLMAAKSQLAGEVELVMKSTTTKPK